MLSAVSAKFSRSLLALALAAPGPLLAAAADGAEAAARSAAPVLDSGYIMQVVGSLALVLICLFGLLALMKKMNGIGSASHQSLAVLSSLKVGNREKILLLQVGQEQLLVGVAAGSVRTLHVLGDSADAPAVASGTRDFASMLPEGAGPAARSERP